MAGGLVLAGGRTPHPSPGSCDVALGNSSRNACSPEGRNVGKRLPEWCQIGTKMSPKPCWERSWRGHSSRKSDVEKTSLFIMFQPHLPPSQNSTIDVLRPRNYSKSNVHIEMLNKGTQKSTNNRKQLPERPIISPPNQNKFV